MNVVLVMFRENGERRSFSLSRDVTLIGRREDADFRIPLTDVSRKHCRLIKDGNILLLEDLGSSNGTYHNGHRVQEAEINPGDTLRIGPVQFIVQINGIPADGDLLGSGMSGLTDSAATMITPGGAVPPPPLPPHLMPSGGEVNQPTIDDRPEETSDDDALSEFSLDERDVDVADDAAEVNPDDAIPSADAEVVAGAEAPQWEPPELKGGLADSAAPPAPPQAEDDARSSAESSAGEVQEAGPVSSETQDVIVPATPETPATPAGESDFDFIDDSPAAEDDEVVENDVLIDFDLPDKKSDQ